MLCRDGEVAHPFPVVMFFLGSLHNYELHMMIFFAPHVFMDVAELMHFTDDDIGFVIKVGNGGGVTKVVSERCGQDRPKDGGMNEGHLVCGE